MQTLATLVNYCRQQAAIRASDYWEPGYGSADEVAAWRHDRRRRDSARAKCFRQYPGRLKFGADTEPLVPGDYGRLTILPDGTPDYCPGQYAPVEVYRYLLRYLDETNAA